MSRKAKKKPLASHITDDKAAFQTTDARHSPNEALDSAGGEGATPARSFGPWDWFFATALIVTVFLVYQPAWQGGLIWDDTEHVTRPELHSWRGLYRIWFDVRATLQYYPLLHSVFWVEHALWGDATLGYHLLNIFLHATAAVMVALLMRRLAIPGAWLAAAVFALHPLQVESVAWITELKNTLSAVFYLGAAMLYLRFEQTRKPAWYLAALALFVPALLTKTVTATLPGALLVIFWWQRGRLSWKNDVLPLAPFFVMGAGMGMITAWWELKLNHCVGPEFQFTWVQRILIAGRVAWFQLAKFFWPTNLTFIYPRWQIDPGAWRQYLFPLGAAALLAVTWAIRHRTRAPLAAVLFFGGTLFPVLGFFNLYTFRYSFTADHYQYLACLGIIALSSAGVALLFKPAGGWRKVLAQSGCVLLLAGLAVLSWRQSRMYADIETLYRTTIQRNSECWMAHTNLGSLLAGRGEVAEAIDQFQEALIINPGDEQAHNNLGNVLIGSGRFAEAIAQYQEALRINPDYAEAHYNLGIALASHGRTVEAIAHYREALRINPDYAEAHYNLGNALADRGQAAEAIDHYRQAVNINPDYAKAHNNLGNVLADHGQIGEAIIHYQFALKINPADAEAHNNLGTALFQQGRVDEAIAHYRKALEIKPDHAYARRNLEVTLRAKTSSQR